MSLKEKLVELIKDDNSARLKRLGCVAFEFSGYAGVQWLEWERRNMVHPAVGGTAFFSGQDRYSIAPTLSRTDNPFLFDFLQHLGDVQEGFGGTFLLYNVLAFLFPNLPEKYKVGISFGVTNLGIAAYEMGWLNNKEPDPLDIPAAVAGSLLYLCLHYVIHKTIESKPIKKLSQD